MSSKKIFAASLAAILATGSVAAVAFAENDDYTWTISGEGAGVEATEYANLKVSTNVSGATALDSLFGTTVTDATDNSKNGYNKVKLGIWEAFNNFDVTEFRGGKITATVAAKAQEYSNALFVQKVTTAGVDSYAPVTSAAYLPKLKDGAQFIIGLDVDTTATYTAGTSKLVVTGILKNGTATDLAAPLEIMTSAAGDDTEAKFWAKFSALKADATEIEGATAIINSGVYNTNLGVEKTDEIEVTATASKDLSTEWKVVKSAASGSVTGFPSIGGDNTDLGKATDPVELELAFEGLGDTLKLTAMNNASSKVEVELDLKVSGGTYDAYVADNYSVNGTPGLWDFNTGTFNTSGGNFQASIPAGGTQFGLVLVGDGMTPAVLPANLAEKPEVKTYHPDLFLTDTGAATVDFAQLISPAVMKNLNNGGTLTFKFNKDMSVLGFKTGYVQYWNGEKRIPLGGDFGYTVDGDSITFEIPAGLTYDEGSLNPYKPFKLNWNFENDTIVGVGDQIWDGDSPAASDQPSAFDGKIVAMTFKANAEAPVDDDPTSDPTDDPATSDPTDDPATSDPSTDDPANGNDDNNNDADNSGADNDSNDADGNGDGNNAGGNPNTGVALAIAPVILAGGAVATVVAKKRK